jgi:hypothetical protein
MNDTKLDSLALPQELDYLRSPADRHSLINASDMEGKLYIHSLTESDVSELAKISNRIRHHDHDVLIAEWQRYDVTADPHDIGYRGNVSTLLKLLDRLGELGLEPFSTNMPHHRRYRPIIDWSKLPDDMQYLVPTLEKYAFLTLGPESEYPVLPAYVIEELRELYEAAEANRQWPIVAAWEDYKPEDIVEWGALFNISEYIESCFLMRSSEYSEDSEDEEHYVFNPNVLQRDTQEGVNIVENTTANKQ